MKHKTKNIIIVILIISNMLFLLTGVHINNETINYIRDIEQEKLLSNIYLNMATLNYGEMILRNDICDMKLNKSVDMALYETNLHQYIKTVEDIERDLITLQYYTEEDISSHIDKKIKTYNEIVEEFNQTLYISKSKR